MDRKMNVSYITLGGYVGLEKYSYVYFLIILTVYILIICFNATIVWLIVTHQSLHEPMYIFIAALLINSLLFSTSIYPKLLVDVLSEKQVISHSVCHFQFFLSYSAGASEFLLLSAMAFDRYVSICKPLQYPVIMRKTSVIALLVLAWFLPVCQFAGHAILSAQRKLCSVVLNGIFCNNSLFKLHCVTSNVTTTYGLIIFLNLVICPFLYIIFTYTKILIVSYRSCREVRRKAAQTCLPHLLVLVNFCLLGTYDILKIRLESHISKTARLILTLQLILYHPLFNPIIYGLKMKKIYKHLRGLFVKVKCFQISLNVFTRRD
ncbi:olfactory receptor 13C5-like [Cheilinus undulatus]|uniref:olfactory receptor 13C5-like n=1 Tax=Cheilinus undulatus TaxID=241271 RepID=UPI001BD4415A|nr:olfactory receptor 13C5-like [Cheilinus undulatus]